MPRRRGGPAAAPGSTPSHHELPDDARDDAAEEATAVCASSSHRVRREVCVAVGVVARLRDPSAGEHAHVRDEAALLQRALDVGELRRGGGKRGVNREV